MDNALSGRLRIDLHVHSRYSYDSLIKPEGIIEAARRRGLAGVAVVDHDTVRGGLEARERNRYDDFLVIPGAEIKTAGGEVIGLFLEKEISSRTLEGAAAEIRAQGGIVLLPHPWIADWDLGSVLPQVDAVEVFNARYGRWTGWTEAPSRPRSMPVGVAGSDAHFYREIGNGVTFFPPPLSPAAIREAIRSRRVSWEGRSSSGWGRIGAQIIKAWKTKQTPSLAKIFHFLRIAVSRRNFSSPEVGKGLNSRSEGSSKK